MTGQNLSGIVAAAAATCLVTLATVGALTGRINPQPNVLLRDDLLTPEGGALPRESSDPTRFAAGYANGQYVIHVNQPYTQGEVLVPGQFGDATLGIDGSLANPAPDQFLQLACRSQTATSQYRFGFRPANGELWINRWVNGAVTTLTSPPDHLDTATGKGAQLHPSPEANRLELACDRNVITASVNGTVVASVADDSFQQGQLWIAAGETPQWARTYPLNAAPAPSGTIEGRFTHLVVRVPAFAAG